MCELLFWGEVTDNFQGKGFSCVGINSDRERLPKSGFIFFIGRDDCSAQVFLRVPRPFEAKPAFRHLLLTAHTNVVIDYERKLKTSYITTLPSQ